MAEAERMDEAIRAMTQTLCGVYDDARFERRAGYDFIVFPRIPLAQFNTVWPLDDSAAASSLGDALEEIERLGVPCSVQIRRGKTPAVEEEAKRLGLTAEETMPGMVATSDDLHGPEVPDLEIIGIRTADGLSRALGVAAAGFEVPADLLAPLYLPELTALDGLAYYLGRVGGRDVSTSVGYTVDDIVGVFNVATPVEHRGRGYGAALTAWATREGFVAGADLAWLQSTEMGLSVYRRLGFREVESYVLLTKPSPG